VVGLTLVLARPRGSAIQKRGKLRAEVKSLPYRHVREPGETSEDQNVGVKNDELKRVGWHAKTFIERKKS